MSKKTAGEYTIELFKRLTEELEKSKYAVYCAHGNSKINNNVCRPTPYFGDYSTASTLSFVDVVVVEEENRIVRIFCEIEESGAPPKKIIGNIVNIILSEKLQIKGNDYKYESPQLVLGIKVKKGGKSEQKANKLKDRLKNAINEQYWNQMGDIRIICASEMGALINEVKSQIRSILE